MPGGRQAGPTQSEHQSSHPDGGSTIPPLLLGLQRLDVADQVCNPLVHLGLLACTHRPE
jgi:hypothetical protein